MFFGNPRPFEALNVPTLTFHFIVGNSTFTFSVFVVKLHVDFVPILLPTCVRKESRWGLIVEGTVRLKIIFVVVSIGIFASPGGPSDALNLLLNGVKLEVVKMAVSVGLLVCRHANSDIATGK